MASLTTLPVSEIFGPTWQGEGPYAGTRTGFVRLGLCNLSCEWCDTPYTWDWSRFDQAAEIAELPIAKIHAQLEAMSVPAVCLSGGEPLLQVHRLRELLDPRWSWHAETNGTIPPPPWWGELVTHTSVSPKINTRDKLSKRINPRALRAWSELARAGRACFKFVAAELADLELVAELVEQLELDDRDVWIMPLGTNVTQLLHHHAALAQGIEDYGWNTTTRLHILLWGQERAR